MDIKQENQPLSSGWFLLGEKSYYVLIVIICKILARIIDCGHHQITAYFH
ncbi:MAG: hypothetical protein JSW35_05255 [Deltaproteobacteria bacterium]|nr:MAG: hypothetical protein JSW35_05255 [Deltaproteobacteria bacterium]